MVWKEIRNGEPSSLQTTLSGICETYKKKAEVTSFFGGMVEYKTDLQKTYRFKGYICSLQKENGYQDPNCVNCCPLIQKEYL